MCEQKTFAYRNRFSLLFFVALALCTAKPSGAAIPHFEAGMSKVEHYVSSGYFVGGNRSVTLTHLKGVRRGPQSGGLERIVLDLQGVGEERDKAPYFQVNVSAEESRILVSIWADVAYDFDSEKLKQAFSKSSHVKSVNVIPRVEDGVATVEFVLKGGKKAKVEAFHLSNPARIIMDVL